MNFSTLISDTMKLSANLAKNDVVKGMVLQAARDIFITRTDREKGYTETKYANEGDDLEIICEDVDNPAGGFRVINHDNFNQIETIPFSEMEDTFNDYGK
ncbi:hypothetical protein [Pseudomonas phage PA1C]|uniref:Uncharacterized protein n=1 Tax=Pseudomonas phage vB_PaeM_PS119XW TaxID=2601632 RepID=A0A5C1K944_9CAUD|nr:hypothetical protein PP933_gp334 [Pseudomonas phage vB_PaeM_PS119XW]QBX32490.1 hypothetical protein [Pseudomonas phage PA1C]QEM42063.1 hypothetical protein [Pseudomonas phage vB_PaeM_PS119XW]BEG72577.1 hypothetical protein RVBP21_2050 [Pseudomonas phage BRkr]